uniref:Uncharacterized protein n=1 Tax=Arundo donax TaxID=35708 RepID=A0A0A9CIA1_ARUDO
MMAALVRAAVEPQHPSGARVQRPPRAALIRATVVPMSATRLMRRRRRGADAATQPTRGRRRGVLLLPAPSAMSSGAPPLLRSQDVQLVREPPMSSHLDPLGAAPPPPPP